jgi:poly(3-hydroxybutyrate) depolymerase
MFRLAVAAVLAAIFVGSAQSQTARVEILPITTTTLKDSEFLAGGKGGQDATIAGELRLPKGTGDKLPAVILLHGSGGVGGAGSPGRMV